MNQKNIFISYSWDSPEHKDWVRKLADSLEEIDEIHVTWDGYDLDSLIDKNLFMESGIYDADLILVISTKIYKNKADQRQGGVGIETLLGTAKHWNDLLEKKSSKFVEIRREENATPRYLGGQFYIDFLDDSEFEKGFQELLALLKDTSKIPRPKKRTSLKTFDGTYSFTRVEEIIRVNYPNRRPIVSAEEGTKFSGGDRIKYELWETRSPALSYFLALSPNINIKQTALHAVRSLEAAKIKPVDMTVLRQRNARPEQELISEVFLENGFPTKIYECTYKEYIWDYCIDETLKYIDAPAPIENYTNQELSFIDFSTGVPGKAESALDYLVAALLKPSDNVAHLVVAPGGMGKTSLCLSVAKTLHNRSDLRSSVVLIQAESIKKYVSDKGLVSSRIESIYDIYEIYAKYQGHSKIFERATFDLAVVCGNLTIIIDGLDEISSLFQDKFDVDSFLESLKILHDQLGSSNILLTTRNNVVTEDQRIEQLGLATYELLGFDPTNSKRYIRKRFAQYANAETLVDKVMLQITKIRLIDPDNRVVPFFADIVATVVEDELRENKGQDFDLNVDATPYASNDDLTDHIIHSILRRENTRHELDITEVEAMQLISGLVADFGRRWLAVDVRDRLKMMYDARAQDIFSKVLLNPLLQQKGEYLELRYSFLSSYMEVIFMLNGIVKVSLESEFLRSMAKLSSDSEEAKEIRRYFSKKKDILNSSLKSLIPQLRSVAVSDNLNKTSILEREIARKSIANLLSLYAGVENTTIGELSDGVLNFYQIVREENVQKTLNGLYIRGDFPAFDFSDLVITNSGFIGYKKFLTGRFLRTKFLFTTFDGCANSSVTSATLDPSMIDVSCDLGDLKENFTLWKIGKENELAIIHSEAKKFLHGFFKGDRFCDNKKLHLRFSTKVAGLASEKFDRLIVEGYVVVKREKTVATFYEIASNFQPSVRKFLTNGYPDGRFKRFLEFVR